MSRYVQNQPSRICVRNQHPCVNVKVRSLKLPRDVCGQDEDGEVYSQIAREWWDTVPDEVAARVLTRAFPDARPRTYSDGRSAGWLCVADIGQPDEWTVRQRRAWEQFEQQVLQSMEDYKQLYIAALRSLVPTARRATAPHGRCAQAGYCVEHAANPGVKQCVRWVR